MHDRHARLSAEIDDHAQNIDRFRRGELSPDQFRPLRLAMGVYAQLAHVKHMQRIKIPGGRMTSEQLEAIADVTERWGRGLAHVTTRQDVQIHHLEVEDSVDLQKRLLEADVTCIGACADTVRNVTASPLAGVVDDEVFDVTPYADAITDHFMFHPHNRKLPRKFKIGLSGSARDLAQCMINDIGLFARVTDTGRGFQIFVAGGLGSTPEIAHLWRDFVHEDDLLAACDAVVSVYFRDGERKNRKKNRLKFLLRKVGEQELLRRFDAEFEEIKAERSAPLTDELRAAVKGFHESAPPPAGVGEAIGDAAFARWRRTNTIAQKQAGYAVATIKLPLGDITSPQLRAVADMCRRYANGEVRATNTQNLLLRWVPTTRLVALHRDLGQVGLAESDANMITDVVSCPGGDYCSLAITRSMAVGASIREHLIPMGSRHGTDDLIQAIGNFEIKISGCPNSCGQHQVADIGLTGLMVTDSSGTERPHYSIRVGGGCGLDARIGDRLDGRVPEDEAPNVIAAIAKFFVAERMPGETFREFVIRKGVDDIKRAGFAAATGVI